MRVIRRPSVYLVGRQVLNEAELSRFLADHNVTGWSTDTDNAAQVLPEVAGRVCYMSFAKPRPGGNKTYLEHIKEVGHGSVLEHSVFNFIIAGVSRSFTHELVRHRAGFGYCLAGDTLVYSDHRCHGKREGIKKRTVESIYRMQRTPHGRSRTKLLRPRCLDESRRVFVNGRVRGVVRSGIKEVFRVSLEDGKCITCSRDHRFLTRTGWKPLHEIVGGLELTPRKMVVHGRLDEPIAVNGQPAHHDKEWLARQYHELGRSQRGIAEECGVAEITIRSWIRKHRLTKAMGSWSKGATPWNKGRRYEAGWKHSTATKAALSAQKRGDKNPQWGGGTTRIAVTLRRRATAMKDQVFCRDAYTCRLCGAKGGRLEIHHIVPIWARLDLAESLDNLATVCIPCHDRMAGRELDFVERCGTETPPFRQLATRKQGSGRTLVPRWRKIQRIEFAGVQTTYDVVMEDPHHNFVANGIVTHNSQLSQRYVDESVADFVEPDCIGDDPELHRVWQSAVDQCQQAYIKLVEGLQTKFADVEDKTLRRKLARQAARSVLPNATETKIFVTANARAWRHFIELRCNEHAETEIRIVAARVCEVLQREAPNLFGDYELYDLPDGTRAARTKFHKV